VGHIPWIGLSIMFIGAAALVGAMVLPLSWFGY
jgi:hypothetical protein